MLFNKKLTATLLAALILTSATNAQAMGWNPILDLIADWRAQVVFGAVATTAILGPEKLGDPILEEFIADLRGQVIFSAVTTVAILGIEKLWAINNANDLGQELIQTAAHGNLAEFQALIAAGADINAQTQLGSTALTMAALNGRTAMVQALIDHGASLNGRNGNGHTPLMGAATYGYIEIARLLIEHGADVNTQDHDGNTALTRAARHGHWNTAEVILNAMHVQAARTTLLIAKNPRNTDNQTPAHQALQAVGRNRILFRQLFETIQPELPTYQWLQEQLGRHYAAYREWKRTQPGEERFDENYNPNRAAAGPANA